MSDVIKLDGKYDYNLLHEEIQNLNIPWHKNHNQISLTHRPGSYDVWYEGCGSLKDTTFQPKDFSVLNENLNGTYLEECYNKLSDQYSIGRYRIMLLKHKKCMSIHVDRNERIHIPVITNENCKMMIDDICYYLEPGYAWWTNTLKPHTAFNGNHILDRVHLLFEIV